MEAKFSGKRPVMFYQPGSNDNSSSYLYGPRIRIFYPNGNVEWCSLAGPSFTFDDEPCWFIIVPKRSRTMTLAIDAANRYDVNSTFPPMQFMGEL